MKSVTSQYLEQIIQEVKPFTKNGKVAEYIPALAKVNPDHLSIAIYNVEKGCLYAGDYRKKFTLQSISKVLSLALVLEERGYHAVFEKVGMEPTGDPFNSIAKLETSVPSKPLNPMINAGALTVTSMILGESLKEKWDKLLSFIRVLANDEKVECNKEVADSEFSTAFLNRALCYFLKQHDIVEGDIEELMLLYTRQCSIEMNCFDLARIGAVFALNGKDPDTGIQIISPEIARICKTFMVTCGMYNASGEFAMKVGTPAKSGVSGGIFGVVPNRLGIGIFGPALDQKGNSVGGVKLLELLSNEFELTIF